MTITLFKFILIGSINTVLTAVLYYFLLRGLHWHYLLGLVVTWTLGTLFTYTLNYTWVFKPEKKFRFNKHFKKYILVYLLSLVINMLLLQTIVEFLAYDPYYTQLGLIPFIVIFNFTLTKYWSLKPANVGS